jgi:hypothetical protein
MADFIRAAKVVLHGFFSMSFYQHLQNYNARKNRYFPALINQL